MNNETKLQNEKIGLSTEKYIQQCIRSSEFNRKEFKKLVIRNKFLTKEELKSYEEYEDMFFFMEFKDFTEFNKQDHSELESKLDKIKEDFKKTVDKSELEIESEFLNLEGEDPYDIFCRLSKEVYTNAQIASDKILDLGDKFENPLIFKAYENINIMADQYFIIINYHYRKFMKALREQDVSIMNNYLNPKILEYSDIIENFKQVIAALIIHDETLSLFNAPFIYNTKPKLIKFFRLKIVKVLEESLNEMSKIKESSKDVVYLKNYFTLINVCQSFYNQIRYMINSLNDSDIRKRAAEFNLFGNEGKILLERLLTLFSNLKLTDIKKNLISELNITEEQLEKALTKHNLTIKG